MMLPQVDGLLEATYGRVDQLEDRYLGMVEAASSNLVSSTLIIHNVLVDATGFVFPSMNNYFVQSNTHPRLVHHLVHHNSANGGRRQQQN